MKKYWVSASFGLLAVLGLIWGAWVSKQPLPQEARFPLDVPDRAEFYDDVYISEPSPAVIVTMDSVRQKIAIGGDLIVVMGVRSEGSQKVNISFWVKDGYKWYIAESPYRVNWPSYADAVWRFEKGSLVAKPERMNYVFLCVSIFLVCLGLAWAARPPTARDDSDGGGETLKIAA